MSFCNRSLGENGYDTCRLKVMVKDFVYITRNGNLTTEPADLFKQWMTKHDYDPEHGKTTPQPTAPAVSGQVPNAAPGSSTPPPQ